MDRGVKKGILLSVVFFPVLIPFVVTNEYYFSIIVTACLWTILTVSLNLILGYTGQISIAHGAFFGIGAYTSALLTLKLNMSFWLALPLAGLMAFVFGLLVGYPTLRLKGAYFAIASMCFGLVINVIITHWLDLTRGTMGLPGIPPPNPIPIPFVGTITFHSMVSKFYLILAFLYVTIFIIHRIVNSRTGRSCIAISQDEILAEAIGVYLMRYKVVAFAISAFFAGIGGSLFSIFFWLYQPRGFLAGHFFQCPGVGYRGWGRDDAWADLGDLFPGHLTRGIGGIKGISPRNSRGNLDIDHYLFTFWIVAWDSNGLGKLGKAKKGKPQ